MLVSLDGRQCVILDVEASALAQGSYPIEIGLVRDVTEPAVSFLIRPAPAWSAAGEWSTESARIHGITQSELETDGVDVIAACDSIDTIAADAVLVSDAPGLDAYWIGELYRAAGRAAREVVGLDMLLEQLGAAACLTADQVEMIGLDVEIARPQSHRAGPDAEVLAAVVRAVIDPAFRATIPIE